MQLGAKRLQEAQDLALVLKAGALPAPLSIIEERTIGPSLGKDSITDGIHAGIVGVTLVVLIMVVYYRWSGRSEEHTSEPQSQSNLVCRLLLEKKKKHA